MKKCKQCDKELTNPNNKFCNRSCAATYNNKRRKPRSEESKIKTAKAVCKTMGIEYKEKNKRGPNPLISATKKGYPYTKVQICTFCKKFFNYDIRPKTTCSDECFIKVKTILNNKGKKQVYKNITMDSSWEVEVAKYLDKLKIIWVRPNWALDWVDSTCKDRKYFPDFYLIDYDIYLDPKNKHCQKLQKEKLEQILYTYDNVIIGTLEYILAYLEGLEPSCNPITLSTGS